VRKLLRLEARVHNCTRCRQNKLLSEILSYPPVYSFGDPHGKHIMVVGQNPSIREYTDGFLSDDRSIAVRRRSQLNYFENRKTTYMFFDEIANFFQDKVKERMHWVDSPWEKVGYLDLVKCPTKCAKGQWSKLPGTQQRRS